MESFGENLRFTWVCTRICRGASSTFYEGVNVCLWFLTTKILQIQATTPKSEGHLEKQYNKSYCDSSSCSTVPIHICIGRFLSLLVHRSKSSRLFSLPLYWGSSAPIACPLQPVPQGSGGVQYDFSGDSSKISPCVLIRLQLVFLASPKTLRIIVFQLSTLYTKGPIMILRSWILVFLNRFLEIKIICRKKDNVFSLYNCTIIFSFMNLH